MKRFLLLLVVIPLVSFTTQNDHSKFIGKWVGEDKQDIGYLNFDAEGYAFFEFQDEIFGGKEFVFEGELGSMSYEINYKTDPIQIDFLVTKLKTGEQKKLLCIVNFIDNNTMEFALNFGGPRPTSFNAENSIVFKRAK